MVTHDDDIAAYAERIIRLQGWADRDRRAKWRVYSPFKRHLEEVEHASQ